MKLQLWMQLLRPRWDAVVSARQAFAAVSEIQALHFGVRTSFVPVSKSSTSYETQSTGLVHLCRFAELMDLTKDRGRLDFFLKKAKTMSAASLDAAANERSLSSPAMGRAGTAPAASTAEAYEMTNRTRSGDTAEAPGETSADPAIENEEALYWRQHGEIEEEEDGGYGEGAECGDAAADVGLCTARWHGAAEHDPGKDDGSQPAGCPSAEQASPALAGGAAKAEPGAVDLAFGGPAGKEEASPAGWHPARVKQEPFELHSSSVAHDTVLGPDPVASLRRFSYTGSPVKQEAPPHPRPAAGHGGHVEGRDHRVLVHLGLDSPKAQLPSSMAARSKASAGPLLSGVGAAACSSATVQTQQRRGEELDAADHVCGQRESSLASAEPEEDKRHAEQQTASYVKQEESCQYMCHGNAAQPPQTSKIDRDALACASMPHLTSPDSWATASEFSRDRQEQGTPHSPASSPGCMEQECTKACGHSRVFLVTDICSPEPAVPQQPNPDSVTGVKGENSFAGAGREDIGIRSPGGSERVDLSAIDLAEQQRLLRLIAARKSLKDDIQASRACMQALSAQALPDSALRKRSRAAAQPHRAPPPVAVTKRRQLGISAFLLSQQRSDGV